MNDILQFLQQRNSAPKLAAPAPSEAQLQEMFKAALRAPDHARLRPWHFTVIQGERREAFGKLLESCLVQRNPDADDAARTKARNAPLRAPLLVVVSAHISEHPKVPAIEQRLSAGCAAHALLLAAEALGFAGIWRTGDAAFDRRVMDGLGLGPQHEIVGIVYLGSRDCVPRPVPVLDITDYVNNW